MILGIFIFWLVLTSSFDLISIMYGIIFCTFSYYISKTIFKDEAYLVFNLKGVKILLFIPYIIFRMYKSSFILMYDILTSNISPKIYPVESNLKGDIKNLIMSNSITLTPGTITLYLGDSDILVLSYKKIDKPSEEIKGRMEDILDLF
ncbi:MAG: Na+/H+ antiporter subunit E [Peptostreptococcaceae bacterium]|jgi:multicomponent Na+:H+ antiporter subunit E|nr:Na+/H+ antiporter subunit E [Peptostreptococcaceae bacterium]